MRLPSLNLHRFAMSLPIDRELGPPIRWPSRCWAPGRGQAIGGPSCFGSAQSLVPRARQAPPSVEPQAQGESEAGLPVLGLFFRH